MWYADLNTITGLHVPTYLHYCTAPRWFWTRADAQAECDRLNARRTA